MFHNYKKILIRNFKSIKNELFSLNDGNTLLTGHIGSGKSTIFDSIYYNLYDDTLSNNRESKVSKDSIVNSINKNMLTILHDEITFDDKSKKNYLIIRGRKSNIFLLIELFNENFDLNDLLNKKIPINRNLYNFFEEYGKNVSFNSKKLDKIQKEFENRFLCISKNIFKSTFLVTSENSKYINLNKQERWDFISTIFDVKWFDDIVDYSKKERKKYKEKLNDYYINKEKLENKIELNNEHINELKEKNETIKKEKDILKSEQDEFKSKYQKIKSEREEFKNKFDSFKNKYNELISFKKSYKNTISQKNTLENNIYNENELLKEKKKTFKKENKRINNKIKEINDELSKTDNINDDDYNLLKSEIDHLNDKIENISSYINKYNNDISTYNNEINKLENEKLENEESFSKDKEKIENDIAVNKEKIEKLSLQLKKNKYDINKLNEKFYKIKNKKENCLNEIESKQKNIEYFKNNYLCDKCGGELTEDEIETHITNLNNNIETLNEKLNKYEKNIKILNKEIKKENENIRINNKINSQINNLKNKNYNKLENKKILINKFEKDNDKYIKNINLYKEKLKKLNEINIDDKKNEKEKLNEELNNKNKKLFNINNNKKRIKKLNKNIKDHKSELETLINNKPNANKLNDYKNKLIKINEEINNHDIDDYNNSRKKYNDKKYNNLLNQYNDINNELNDIEYKIKIYDDKINNKDDTANLYLNDVETYEKNNDKINKELSSLDDDNNNNIKEFTVYDNIIKLFGDNEFKSIMFNKYVKLLNNYITNIIDKLKLNFSIKFEDDFDVTISGYGFGEEYGTYSKGERHTINMIIFVTFNNLLKSLTKFDCNLIMFDEFLDIGQDSDNLISLFNFIIECFSNKNLLIISHKSILENNENIVNHYSFNKETLFTKITNENK